MNTILILASSGSLAKHIVIRAIEIFGIENIIISDYKADRLKLYKEKIDLKYKASIRTKIVDIRSEDSLLKAIDGVGYVIVPVSQQEPIVQKVCFKSKVSCIDLSVSKAFIVKVLYLNETLKLKESTSLVAAGLFPGLSGILAQDLINSDNEIVNIGLVQSVNGTAGNMGIIDMLKIFSSNVLYLDEVGERIKRGFTHKKPFLVNELSKVYNLRLSNFIERDYLLKKNIRANYWSGFDLEWFNAIIMILQRIKFLKLLNNNTFANMLGRFISSKKTKTKVEDIIILGESSKRSIKLRFTSDYLATAECVCIYIELISQMDKAAHGVFFPYELFDLDSMLNNPNLKSNI